MQNKKKIIRFATQVIIVAMLLVVAFCLDASIHAVYAQTGTTASAPSSTAPPPSKIDTGDTAWMLMSTALVLLMTPGLALFYGGMVRSKNVLSVLMQSFIACGLITVEWLIYGYSMAFGPSVHGIFGNLSWLMLNHVSATEGNADYCPTVPHQLFCMFQLMFAIITPALISGAIVERMKFSAYLLFMLLWATFVYNPLAHWVWSANGWLHKLGALDFAGGSVVHMSSGFSALTLAWMLGKRKRTEGGEELRPHNLPMTLIGAALLWFGWFGFNAGSAIGSNGLAVSAFVATHVATGAAALTWLFLDWIMYKRPSALGFASGAVAGLVAITPACGFVTPVSGLIIGILVAIVCFFAIKIKNGFKVDDSLDVFGVHGCGGLFGALATGFFATKAINPAGANGLFYGHPHQVVLQLIDIVSTIAIAVIGTFIIGNIVKVICGGLRTSTEEEENGLDITEHGEAGYSGDNAGVPAYQM